MIEATVDAKYFVAFTRSGVQPTFKQCKQAEFIMNEVLFVGSGKRTADDVRFDIELEIEKKGQNRKVDISEVEQVLEVLANAKLLKKTTKRVPSLVFAPYMPMEWTTETAYYRVP